MSRTGMSLAAMDVGDNVGWHEPLCISVSTASQVYHHAFVGHGGDQSKFSSLYRRNLALHWLSGCASDLMHDDITGTPILSVPPSPG